MNQPFPELITKYLVETTKTYPVAINGRTRTEMTISLEASQADVEAMVLSDITVQKWLDGKPPKKIIYVKGKMVNIVL